MNIAFHTDVRNEQKKDPEHMKSSEVSQVSNQTQWGPKVKNQVLQNMFIQTSCFPQNITQLRYSQQIVISDGTVYTDSRVL